MSCQLFSTQIRNLSFDSEYPSESYTSLERQGITLHIDINYMAMSDKMKVQIIRKFENCNFH